MLEVSADVYNLDMHLINQIKHDRLTINKLPNYDEIVGPFKRLETHSVTAKSIVAVPDDISNHIDALEYARNYLSPYFTLLSFAQDHDVYFNNLRCYDPNQPNTILASTTWGRLLGKPWAGSNVHYLNEFLSTALPLFNDDRYDQKTGLRWTLILYNTANFTVTIETQLALFVAGLERLANIDWDIMKETDPATTPPWLFDDSKWESLIDIIGKKAIKLGIEPQKRNQLLSRFGELKDPPIKDKIKNVLKSHGLPQYGKELNAIYNMRNDFLHGREMQVTYGELKYYEVATGCQRLLLKLILKLLRFYVDWPKVHSAILNNDLTAVE